MTIPAKGFLIVWASSKDRRVPGSNLHTNFSLSADGEYLGLIKPDGVTRTTEFAPTFPAQTADISYGISGTAGKATLSTQGSPVRVLIPTSNNLGSTWQARGFDDSAWLTGTLAVGFFNYGKISSPDLSSLLGLDLKTQSSGNGKSAYLRIPFTVTEPTKVSDLKFSLAYDDGFAAYLNGTLVATANAPSPLEYNSQATTIHSPAVATVYDLASLIPQLAAGTNVLAIHGLNGIDSSDFFIGPELTAQIDTGRSETGYFPVSTPGAANGGPDTVQLPQVVSFSRASGPFTTSFDLTLTGAAAGQQIRYNIADPTTATGAAVPAPTAASTLYTGPIPVSGSKLVRAAVFNPENNQLGGPSTAQYLLLETGATLNTSNFTSNLPIFVIDDHGRGEAVDSSTLTYTTGMLYLFDRNASGVATLNSTPTSSNRAGFRIRGRSSSTFPKKSYGLETWNERNNDLKTSLLGLDTESDWIFNGPWRYDDVYFHNSFMYELSRRVGRWAPRTRLTEVFTSINGATAGQSKLDYTDYNGVYQLIEKLESGKGRLDITELKVEDIAGDALTGGYIFKIDDLDSDEVGWTTQQGFKPVIVEPDSNEDRPQQIVYLESYVQAFETTLFSEQSTNFATRNYRRYIDVSAWVDNSLLNVLAFNVDAFRLSSYFFKDRNARINAGPAWDFDRSLGSDDGRDANPRTWSNMAGINGVWWGPLLKDPEYVQAWVDRWWELRGGAFSNNNLNILADTLGNEVGNAAAVRDAARWPGATTGNNPESGSYAGEVAAMKTWLTSTNSSALGRAPWMDTQFPGPPTASLDTAAGVTPGTSVTLGGSGTIRYALNNTDPRPYGGGTGSAAATYSSGAPLVINQTTVLTARRAGTFTPHSLAVGISWSAPLQRVYLVNEVFAGSGNLVVNEIHYKPADPTEGEKSALLEPDAAAFEYVELKNVGTGTINTFEVQFADTMPFKGLKLAPLSLLPGETALVVKSREAFTARYGTAYNARIIGEWVDGSLNNAGERIRLLARDGGIIQDFIFPDLAGGGGSLNRVDATIWRSEVPSPGSDGPTYTQWKIFYFPAAGENSSDNADPDGDGATNLAEYMHGTNPVVSEDQSVFVPRLTLVNDGSGTNYAYTYRKPQYRPSAQYQVQQSGDLVQWANVNDTLTGINAGVETRSVNISTAAATPTKLFYRLRTTLAP